MVFFRRYLCSLCFILAVHGKKETKDTTPKEPEIERALQLRTHTIFPPYIDQDLQNRWWDFGADAYVNTNKHIRLTQNKPSQMGWLWSRMPLTAQNWQVEVEFKISGKQGHLYGDGMALWLTTERAKPGPVFGSKDMFDGLAIFIDTYSNAHHNFSFPRIMAMVGDGKTKYIQEEDGVPNAIAACSASVRRTNVATKLKLTYVPKNSLDLKIQYKAWDEWTPCFTIPNIELPTNGFLGFTAMTGDVADAHDIISVSSSSLILVSGSTSKTALKQSGPRLSDRTAEYFSFSTFLTVLFVGVIFALVGMAARTYARQQGGLHIGNFEVLNRAGALSFQAKSGKRF